MMVQIYIPVVILVAISLKVTADFTPTGKYDLSMEELAPLCDMVKEFAQTGKAPEPKSRYEPLTLADGGCIYYKWTPCATQSSDPKRPCGTYEMRQCESKKKRSALLEHSHHAGHHEVKRDAVLEGEDGDVGPVILGFPDEFVSNFPQD